MNKLTCVLSAVLMAGSVQAADSVATLAKANGSVLINNGKQFVTVQPGKVLVAGDRLMVMEGASAQIRYNDGCLQALNGGSMLVVSAKSVCAGGLANVSSVDSLHAQAAGDEKTVDGKTWVWVAAAAGVAAVWMLKDDKTKSP